MTAMTKLAKHVTEKLVCPCCGAKASEPKAWPGCEGGLPDSDCATGKCGNPHAHNDYGCGVWQNLLDRAHAELEKSRES